MVKCLETFASLAKHKITIEKYTSVIDNYGGFTNTWVTEYTVYAIINPRSGKEFVQADQKTNTINTIITIRYISGLSNILDAGKRRIKFGDRYYDILSVQNVNELKSKYEGKVYQIFTCQETKKESA